MNFSALSILNNRHREGLAAVKAGTDAQTNIETPLDELSRSVLTSSLTSVRCWLQRAAREWRKDDEFVHQLRVSGRRALSGLSLFDVLVPGSEVRWFRKRLKSILQAAGRARDLDVLIRTELPRCGKAKKTLGKQWQAERAAAQKPLVALHRKLNRKGRFRKHMRSLVQDLNIVAADAEHETQSVCDARVLTQFADLGHSVVKALEIEADVRSLHALRIAVKRLRYAADLLLPVLKGPQVQDAVHALPELQKQLGAMQDHVVAKQELKRSVKKLKKRSDQKIIQELIEIERRSIADSVATLCAWLETDACRELKTGIESIV
jgi:CHAD domain-containing protein